MKNYYVPFIETNKTFLYNVNQIFIWRQYIFLIALVDLKNRSIFHLSICKYLQTIKKKNKFQWNAKKLQFSEKLLCIIYRNKWNIFLYNDNQIFI